MLAQLEFKDAEARPARVVVAFDGFLSDIESLRAELPSGFVAATAAAEIVAQLYLAFGPERLDRLTGHYALCVIDERSCSVRAWRDRLGGRALYWTRSGNGIALATNSACLARLKPATFHEETRFIARRLSLQSNRDAELTAFSGVREVLPGERLSYVNGKLARNRRPFTLGHVQPDLSVDGWVERFGETLGQSVTDTLGETGAVAVMLSGGLDSGPMALLAQQQLAVTERELIATSWFLPQHPQADESRWIQLLCRELGLPLHAFDGEQLPAYGDLDCGVISPEVPAYNPYRGLINHCYASAAAAGCSVILNGNAGDHLYPPWRLFLIDQWRRRGLRAVAATLTAIRRARGWRALLQDRAVRHPIGRLLPYRRRPPPPHWLTPWAAEQLAEPSLPWPPEADEHPFPDYARQLLGRPMTFGRAQENNTVHAYGLERRDAYHNEAFVRLMLEMPFDLSFRAGQDKWIMRRIMIGRLPEPLRSKRRTGLLNSFSAGGFELNRRLIIELLFNRNREWQRYVKAEFVRSALGASPTTEKDRLVITQCIGYALWREYWEG